MPTLNVEFTEREIAIICSAAEESNRSLTDFVREAAVSAAGNPKALVPQVAAQVADQSAELLARLM